MHLGIFQNIQWPEGTTQRDQFDNAIEQTLLAEAMGFESAYWVEHHWTRHGILSSTLALLAYLAARTSTIRLGTAVLVLPFHDPARLAEEASTVDLLSNGRLDLGVGRGFQWVEFNGFDIPMAESTARYDEALEVILRAWTSPGRFSFEGRFWSYNDVSIEPRPLQLPHPPVWAAAGSEEAATRAGRRGLNLMLSSGVSLRHVPKMMEAYRSGLAAGGHGFSGENVLLSRMTHLEATRQRAWEVAGPPFDWFRRMVAEVTPPPGGDGSQNASPLPPILSGEVGASEDDPGLLFCTPDECNRYLEDVAALGVGHVIFQGNWGGMAQDDVVRSLRLLADEVLPHFRERGSK